MTFAELRQEVRNEILVDEYEDAFQDEDIDNALWRASFEVAAAFDLPRVVDTVSGIAAGATTFTAPARCAQIHLVMLDGDDARPADLATVLRMQRGQNQAIRYFNYDPRRGGDVYIAPPTLGGTATVEFTRILTRPSEGDFDDAEPWEGVMSEFHPIIIYRAGIMLFNSEERQDEAEVWKVEYQTRAQEIAASLGRTDMASLMVEAPQRNDQGAEG